MKASLIALIPLVIASLYASAAEPPTLPKPVKEHEWLERFVGDWSVETEIITEPGKPPITSTGTEKVKMIGGFWVMGQTKGEMMGAPFTGVITLGYDPDKKKYVGSWIDSNTSTYWQYVGTLDETGNKLTLESEGMCPMEGKVCQFRDTIEFKSDNHRVMTGAKKSKDGNWETMLTVTSKRK